MSEQQPGLDPEFAKRMRSGLATMAVRERRRERARNKAIGVGLATAAVAGVIAIAFGQLGLPQPGSDDAVPTETPTMTPTVGPTATPEPTSTPEPTTTPEPTVEPTPPPGFEGIAAGEPVVVEETFVGSGRGDAAGPQDVPLIDIYVLCQGNGQVVDSNGYAYATCADEAPNTLLTSLAMPDYPDRIDIVASPDFDGTVEWVPQGEQPSVASQGGTATVYVTCDFGNQSGTFTASDVTFDCPTLAPHGGDTVVELAAWGVPYEPGEFGPQIAYTNLSTGDDIRIVLDGPL